MDMFRDLLANNDLGLQRRNLFDVNSFKSRAKKTYIFRDGVCDQRESPYTLEEYLPSSTFCSYCAEEFKTEMSI